MRNQRIKTTPEPFDQTSDETRRTELFVEENAKIVNDAIGMEWHQKIGTIQPPLSHGAVGVTQLSCNPFCQLGLLGLPPAVPILNS